MKPVSFFLALFCFFSAGAQLPGHTITVATPQSNGYYFFTLLAFQTTAMRFIPEQVILDNRGNLVYHKVSPEYSSSDFTLQRDGRMSLAGINTFYLLDSTFTIVDSVGPVNGVLFDGHELQVLPNGHYLLLGAESVTMDLSSYNLFNGNNPGSTAAIVKSSVIQELDQNKNLVFEWHAKDHYNFTDVDPIRLTDPNMVDWTHANALELDADGNILMSLRHFNEITKINRSNGNIIWRLGGNANQFTFTNDAPMFKGQHDIRRLANGNISLYDDGAIGPPLHPAMAKEYTLNENALTATIAWSYTENPNTYSGATGNVQRLANGNTLINYGQFFNENIVFNVVTPNGSKVFEIAFHDSLSSYRAFNYPSLPWDPGRPVVTCYTSNGQTYLDAGSGHASYKWSNGDSTQAIAVTATGNYQVGVPKGQGGFIYSEVFSVSDLNNICAATGLIQLGNTSYQVYPNPFNDQLRINGTALSNANVTITDLIGKQLPIQVKYSSESLLIDVSNLSSGVYLLNINGRVNKLVKE